MMLVLGAIIIPRLRTEIFDDKASGLNGML